ncbi:hypothetical protein JMJ35_003784 [Cladonia borealis]|uniref:Uncharacterized protein n=1 Tax=Cladonia borealis TaxID=184061 RepID=A0AA39V353_9LECA|nr:hypothetical protein JMJ35_003784 [Cladonia borealis]
MDVTRGKIREARYRNADGRWFVPEGSLVSALEVIRQSLQNHCDVEPFAVQWMIQAIEKGGRKTFAALILIREEKKIIAFLEHYLQSDSQNLDSRLPFSKSELETILSPDVASEFYEHQWELIAPVFTHRLLHRNIPIEFILPFVESRRIGGGGFGDVYEVVITAGHHKFKDINTTKV